MEVRLNKRIGEPEASTEGYEVRFLTLSRFSCISRFFIHKPLPFLRFQPLKAYNFWYIKTAVERNHASLDRLL